MFKYPADRIPVSIILGITFIDFLLYFMVESFWIIVSYWALMIIPKGKICAWNHHHQHTPTFRQKGLNRLLEFFYALHSGVTTHLWLLHHVLGHHHNYLDQTKDESRWKRLSGEPMGVLEYTLNVAVTAYYRGYRVGKRYPKLQRTYLFFSFMTFIALALLVVHKPMQGTFLFLLPMVTGLLLTCWATFGHHAGLETDNVFESSYNNINKFYNLTTGNLGYHTAHHYKQGVHWSKLPELHEMIKDKIPPQLIKNWAI